MRRLLLLFAITITYHYAQAQLPGGAIWGCPSVPIYSEFDTTCFLRTGEIKLGQGYFDHYGASDPVYLVIPNNRPDFAISMAVAWNYYRNTLGRDGMSINQWFATMGQENGFAAYNGITLPATVYDQSSGTNVAIPPYPRGIGGVFNAANYAWHVTQNGNDGAYHNTLAGYQTVSPYVPARYPGPATTYHPLFNSNIEMASMNKTYYDLSIYRRAQYMNGVDLTPIEQASPDPYGIEAAQAVAYNLGPNSPQAISVPGYTAPAGIATNNNWSVNYYNGGVSCYAQRIASMTAVLDNNQAYATSHYNVSGCGSANNWNFYSFYDYQVSWAQVQGYITDLMPMYPEMTGARLTAFTTAVQTAFNQADADANGTISFRYEMGSVIDAITMGLPKDDPAFAGMYAINGTGCKLDCRAPYTNIVPSGPTTICVGQSVILSANVDSPTPSVTYQWQRNGVNIAGATSQTYTVTPSVAGSDVYSVIVCWSTTRQSNGAAVTCCAQPECNVTITAQGSCTNCVMNMTLTPTSNACTGMPNGSIQVTVSGAGASGNLEYIWSGPSSGSITTTALTYTITGLRDGKYTVEVRRASDHNCRAVKDVMITPTTIIKEALSATANNTACPVQLQATLINQQPNRCNLNVYYGALDFGWDRAFFMDLRINGAGVLTMFEGMTTGSRAWQWSAPVLTAATAPNTTTISVQDGDTITTFGSVLIPQGTAVPSWYNGGVRLESATGNPVTFTRVGTGTTSNFFTSSYQAPVASAGTRQFGNAYVVTCPVVSPPAYTYSWSPATGVNNVNIANPTVSINTPPSVVYTVTATHPTNPACQLTATTTVTRSCAPLPVEFLYFDAVESNNTGVLSWTTAHEVDCKEYIVQKSRDGIHFTNIGTVACNNVERISEYGFVDRFPYQGITYYRIAQIDLNGATAYTETESIYLKNITAQIYPNPFNSAVNVVLNGEAADAVDVKVLDVYGRVLYSASVQGNAHLTLGAEYSSALYIIQVTHNNSVNTYEVVKQ